MEFKMLLGCEEEECGHCFDPLRIKDEPVEQQVKEEPPENGKPADLAIDYKQNINGNVSSLSPTNDNSARRNSYKEAFKKKYKDLLLQGKFDSILRNVTCQTSLPADKTAKSFCFECSHFDCDAAVQCNI